MVVARSLARSNSALVLGYGEGGASSVALGQGLGGAMVVARAGYNGKTVQHGGAGLSAWRHGEARGHG